MAATHCCFRLKLRGNGSSGWGRSGERVVGGMKMGKCRARGKVLEKVGER